MGSIRSFWEFLSWKNVGSFPLFFFSASTEIALWLYPHSINMACHIYWFLCLGTSLHPRDKFPLITLYSHFNVLLNLVANETSKVFYWDFYIHFHQGYWPVIFFYCNVLVWFCYQSYAVFVKLVWMYSLFFNFLGVLEKYLVLILLFKKFLLVY